MRPCLLKRPACLGVRAEASATPVEPAALVLPTGGSYSLRKRLIAAILGVSVFIWMVSLGVIVTVAWHETSDVFDDALKEGARLALVLGASMQSQGALAGTLPREASEPTKLRIYYQIVSDDGRMLQRAERAPAKAFSADLKASKRYLNVWVDGELWRVYVLRAKGQNFQVQIGQQWEKRSEVLGEMAQNLAWPALFLLAMLGAFCWWAIRKLLAPIEVTAQRIAAKSVQDLSAVSVETGQLQTAAWRWRVVAVLDAITMVALVALTRVCLGVHCLGVHCLSDVLAAFAEGVAWLMLCLIGLHTYWEHRASRKNAQVVPGS